MLCQLTIFDGYFLRIWPPIETVSKYTQNGTFSLTNNAALHHKSTIQWFNIFIIYLPPKTPSFFFVSLDFSSCWFVSASFFSSVALLLSSSSSDDMKNSDDFFLALVVNGLVRLDLRGDLFLPRFTRRLLIGVWSFSLSSSSEQPEWGQNLIISIKRQRSQKMRQLSP